MQNMNLMRLTEEFHSEDICRDTLVRLRWPDGVTCPRCNGKKHGYDSKTYRWDCYSCGYGFTVMSGTILHDTKLPLRTWMLAVMLMVEAKKGISANQMKRTMGVSYKTAWYLCHRIRHAMTEVTTERLTGIVEVDETYVGGKVRGKGKGYIGNKAVVVGAVQRGGNIRLQRTDGNSSAILHEFIRRNTDGTTTVYTDEHPSYRAVKSFRNHDAVEHRKEEWARGDVHTNNVENVWSLFKRSVIGSYHKVSEKHLDSYLDELEWRFNNRENKYLFRDTLVKLLESKNLEYKELIQSET
jgi:transposase-like protein